MDLSITGPKIYFSITLFQDVPFIGVINVTQTMISSLVVMIALIVAAYFLGRNLTLRPSRRQVLVEKGVSTLYNFVGETMGEHNLPFAPYIGALFLSSVGGTLIGMTQVFRAATADLSTTFAWALATTAIVWYYKIKNQGFLGFLKGFTEPIAVMTPMNIVSEIANPISLAFRHFGNIAGGSVLTALIYTALAALNNLFFGWLPKAIFAVFPPIFQVGIPAFLSIYFDLFSAFVQALVFCLLTMVYIGEANPPMAEALPSPEEH